MASFHTENRENHEKLWETMGTEFRTPFDRWIIEDLALQPAPFSRVRSTRLDRRILRIDLFEIDLLQPHIVHGGLDSPQPKTCFFLIFTQFFSI